MGEAQEALEAGADPALEAAHARRVGDVQALERFDQALGEHQQRCLLEVRDQEQQEVLVAELRQHAALAVGEVGRARVADHHQRVAAAQVAGPGRRATGGPEAVVAVTALEVVQMRCGVGQRARARILHLVLIVGVGRPRASDQAEAHEIIARERTRIIDREEGGQRHAVVFDLPVAQHAALLRVGARQRLHQPRPVRGNARRAMAADVGHERGALVRIRLRQHAAVAADPFGGRQAVQRAAVGVPARRVGAPGAVHQLLHLRQRHVVAGDLDVQDHHIDVEEEVQMHMHHVEHHRRVALARGDAHRGDVAAPEHAHRRAGIGVRIVASQATLAVQKLLHVGQEGDELGVVALLEDAARQLGIVLELAPRAGLAHVAQDLPRPLLRARAPRDRQ